MNLEEIKQFLPKYLSSESQKELFDSINQFPNNANLYTNVHDKENTIFQGDGFREMLIINLPSPEMKHANGMVFSNTCDIAPENKRLFTPRVTYSPIISLKKYESLLERKGDKRKIGDHISAIRNQRITQIFYLPSVSEVIEESIVFFDRICNNSVTFTDKEIQKNRLFTLSNYGFYLFLVKLSIHFTRIQEGLDRSCI